MTPFQTYSLFIALRNHFTTKSYDFFKYQGKTRASVKSFENAKNKYLYEKLGKAYPKDYQLTDLIVANMIKGRKWVTDLLDGDGKFHYTSYVKYKESLTRSFTGELDKLLKEHQPEDLFRCPDKNTFPPVIMAYMENEISLQTLVILNCYVGFVDKLETHPLASFSTLEDILFLIRKLTPFVKFDKGKITPILETKLLNTGKGESNGPDCQQN